MSEFDDLLPQDEELKAKDSLFKKLLKKYSNCKDNEDDGYDFKELIAICEDIDDKMEIEVEMAQVSDDEEDPVRLQSCQELALCKNNKDKYEVFSKEYGQDFIDNLTQAYSKRCAEAEKLNLSFWTNSKTTETFNESNIKTKAYEATSKQYARSTEQSFAVNTKNGGRDQNCTYEIPGNDFRFLHPLNPNTSLFKKSHSVPIFNSSLQQQQIYNIRVREVFYDYVSVGNDVTEFLYPNQSHTLNTSKALHYPEKSSSHHYSQQNEIHKNKTTDRISPKNEPKTANKRGVSRNKSKVEIANSKKANLVPEQKLKLPMSYSDCVKLQPKDQKVKNNQVLKEASEEKRICIKNSKDDVTKSRKMVENKKTEKNKSNRNETNRANIDTSSNLKNVERSRKRETDASIKNIPEKTTPLPRTITISDSDSSLDDFDYFKEASRKYLEHIQNKKK